MDLDKTVALELWDDIYGRNQLWAQDPFGTWMYRNDYGKNNVTRNNRPGGNGNYYTYCWEIDHIKPKSTFTSENSATFLGNLQPMHSNNNREKSDQFPTFKVNGRNYYIRLYNSYNGPEYRIYDSVTNARVDQKPVR